MKPLDCPRELLEQSDDPVLRCSRASSILTHLQIASSDPGWRPPLWHGAAIRLACSLLRGADEAEIQNTWGVLITRGATHWYVRRVLASLEEA